MFFQIARETILLLVNNIHEKIWRKLYIHLLTAIGMRNFKPHIK